MVAQTTDSMSGFRQRWKFIANAAYFEQFGATDVENMATHTEVGSSSCNYT